MGIVSGILEGRSSLANPDQWLVDVLSGGNEFGWLNNWLSGGSKSAAGKVVTVPAALRNIAVYACIRVIAEDLATLPLQMFERLAEGKGVAQDHPLYPVLHDRANPEMTSVTFLETLMGHVLGWGNGFAWIARDNAGRVRELWPLRPDRVRIRRKDGKLIYAFSPDVGGEMLVPFDETFHLPGLGFDGIQGYSPIALAREAVGIGLAAEEYAGKLWSNDARPSVVLKHPGTLSDKAYDNLVKSWSEKYGGSGNAHKPAILEENMTLEAIGIPPEDAQFLETRKFQVTEIARLYRVPPHMIGDLERATFSNIEHQGLQYTMHTLRPWARRLEATVALRLLTPQERGKYFAEFNLDALHRGDMKSRYEAYHIARNDGWINGDEIRAKENMNPMPGDKGKVYIVPLNMMELGSSPEEAGASRQRALERRSKSPAYRRRLRQAYRGLYADAAKRILFRQRSDVIREAKRILGQRSDTDLMVWLDEYYHDTELLTRHLAPVNLAYAEAIHSAAIEEVGDVDKVFGASYQSFVDEYSQGRANKYALDARQRNQAAVSRAIEAETDILEALEADFDEMEETWPDHVAGRETVQLGGAIARFAFIAAGFGATWAALGSHPCPWCEMMDGMSVSGDETFLDAGGALEAGEESFEPSGNICHPPLHDG